MIRIEKPTDIPKILLSKGKSTDDSNRKKYDASPLLYAGKQSLIPKKDKLFLSTKIYGVDSVKKVLKDAQKGKCCFCEKSQNDEYGAVEHYRPKGGFKAKRKDKITKPGYFWLCYDWSNLYFVCGRCNNSKGNLFPLVDESKRVKDYKFEHEIPLLIDPAGKLDPRKHITFDKGLAVGKSKYGVATIKICRLNREALNDDRKELIENIEARIDILAKKDQYKIVKVDKAKKFILDALEPNAKYSAVARDFLSQFNIVIKT